jgi:hypothetical protein
MGLGSWILDVAVYHGVGKVYEIILSSYFWPLLWRYAHYALCTTHRSPKGKEIILSEGDSLAVALGSWALGRGFHMMGEGTIYLGLGSIFLVSGF